MLFHIADTNKFAVLKETKNTSISNGIIMLIRMEPDEFRVLQIHSIAHHSLKEICKKQIREQASVSELSEKKAKIKNMLVTAPKFRMGTRNLSNWGYGTEEE